MGIELPATTKDITVEWLNEVLHENGFLKDAKIVSLDIEKFDVGLASDVTKLVLSYDEDAKSCPNTLIAKFPSTDKLVYAMMNASRVYEKEIRFYSELAPKSPIRTPMAYYCHVDAVNEKYILLIEDCSDYSTKKPWESLTYEEVKIAVENIARFHAYWWNNNKLSELSWLSVNELANWVPFPNFRRNWDTITQNEDFIDALPEGGLAAGQKIYETMSWWTNSTSKDNLTLVHRDYRTDNFFFDWYNAENPLVIFDWGLILIERGGIDIGILLGSCLTIDLRKQNEQDLLKTYFNTLLECGVSKYSFEQFMEDYKRGLLIRFIDYIHVLGMNYIEATRERKDRLNNNLQRQVTAIVDNNAISIMT